MKIKKFHHSFFKYNEFVFHQTLFTYAGGSFVQPLAWAIRLKVAIGAARGLAFLHTSEKQVIYRDFKASNILLDGVKFCFIYEQLSRNNLTLTSFSTH